MTVALAAAGDQPAARYADLEGRIVFVSGGGAGIGAEMVAAFAEQGARVFFADIDVAAGEALAAAVAERAPAPRFIACDVTDDEAFLAALGAAESEGGIAALVNNAANDTRHTVESYTPEEWDQSINVNLRPYYFTTQFVLDDMRASGGGTIVNFSSVSYMMGNGDYPAYVAAKAGITGLTRGLARELGPDKIRVNALMPGWVLTDRQKRLWVTPDGLDRHIERQCLKEELVPLDMVCPTLFLASEASRMMTGQALVIDGGVVVTG